jgi:hypothetical protein
LGGCSVEREWSEPFARGSLDHRKVAVAGTTATFQRRTGPEDAFRDWLADIIRHALMGQ